MNQVQNQENKIKRIFLAVLLFFAFGCILAGGLLFGTPKAAHAETLTLSSETNASLFLPESYENYLNLTSPSSVAIGERYTAVADEKKIYVYDRSDPKKGYRVWEHKKDTNEVTVGKMQFTDDNRLFFSSASGLFELTLEGELSEEKISEDFFPYTFLISDGILYAVTTSEGTNTVLYRFKMGSNIIALKDATNHQTVLDLSSQQSSPLLAYAGGTVYCSLNGYVYKYSGDTLNGSGNFSLDNTASGVLTPGSICAIGDKMYFTDGDGLHCTDTSGNAELLVKAEGLNALYPRGNLLYCLWGKAIRAFDTATGAFTDYEISSSSASVGRLSGAKDVVRAGSLIVIADTSNHRVTVYNGDTGAYFVLAPEDNESFSPTLVATDGKKIATVSADKIYVCEDPFKHPTFEAPETLNNGSIVGIACVYGKVYYVTQNNIQGELNGQSATKSNNGTPFAMTSDLYGNLYVAYNDDSVRVFTEEQFTASGEQGTKIEGVTIPKDAKSLRADFKGNLYYLDKDGNFCNKDGICATVNGANYVYHSETNVTPTSFALGFEDDAVSFLFGDFIVTSHEGALGFPTLSTIDASSAYDAISQVQAKEEVTLLDVKEDAIGVRVDLQQLNSEAAYFPYTSYGRNPAQERAVLLTATENGDYNLVALYEGKSYRVELFRTSDCLTDPVPVWTGETGERYLSCEAHLYNFPCLTAARSEEKLPRGSKVTLLDVVQADGDKTDELDLGLDFAYIQVETKDRTVCTAYLPLSFLSELDPNGMEREDFTLGTLKKDILLHGVENSEDSFTVKKGEQVRLYDNGDGTFTVKTEQDGVLYQGQVEKSLISRGESDALRIALIVILTVLAVLIVGAYAFLLSGRKKKS